MQHDERATHLAYKACLDRFISPLVSAHMGSIAKSTGDGFFAQFDSVVSAMECAVAVQAELPDFLSQNDITPALQFRLGVSWGDVISEEEDIYGNDVNLAARLQEEAPPGSICITAETYYQIRTNLTAQFENLGNITFKNSGAPTLVYACYPEGMSLWSNMTKSARIRRYLKKHSQNKPFKIMAVCSLTASIAISGFFGLSYFDRLSKQAQISASLAPASGSELSRPSIAVLAFENRSQSPETHALSRGIGDTVATALAASQRFFVIDPKSSLEFSSSSPSIKDIAKQLNVRFLLLGSINQKGQKIRINARLVDTESGRNHWAYSVSEDLNKVFDVEDRIAGEVVAALSGGPRSPAKKLKQGGTRNFAAYEPYLKGWQILNSKPNPDLEAAISYFEKAISHDPNYGDAHAALADAFVKKSLHVYQTQPKTAHKAVKLEERLLSHLWITRQDYLETARSYLATALKYPTTYAYRISAQINFIKNDYDAATRDARNAYLSDPNNADSAAEYGMSLIWNGETEDGVTEVKKAIRTNPKGKRNYGAYLGIAKFVQGQYQPAIADLESALDVDPQNELVMIHLIASYGHLEKFDTALSLIERLNKVRAKRSAVPIYIQRIMRKLPYKLQASKLQLVAGLHKAGMKFGIRHAGKS